jgi:predicted AlkP superfamily phosphohydrolase/phosphomutase
MKKKVLVIGLDGATMDLVKPWVKEGKLPNMARIMQQGAYGPLRSVIPPISPPAWTSIITGQNPGRYGIYDFVAREPGSYHLQSARRDLSQLRTVFGILSQAGKRVGVVNVPLTYPPEKVNGFMVSGLKAPLRGHWTYPVNLQKRLKTQGYWIDLREPYHRGENEEAFIKEMLETAEMRAETSLALMNEIDWDFFMVVFRGTDDALLLWHLHDPTHPLHDSDLALRFGNGIERVYRKIDHYIGKFLDKTGPETNTLIVSDHGGGPVYKAVYLNNWLHKHGWLQFKHQGPVTSGVKGVLRQLGLTRDAGWKFLSLQNLARVKKLFPSLVQWVPQSTPTMAEMVDWERTHAYSFGYIGQIYINLQGREPQGIVAPGEEYERLIGQIKEALLAWKDPDDGDPIVDAVYHKDELYSGAYLDRAPDICVIMRDVSYVTQMGQEFTAQSSLGPPLHTGTHRLDGLFMASGQDICPGFELNNASLIDITPTILYLMDLPIPTSLDGQVLKQAFLPALIKRRPIRYVKADEIRFSSFLPERWGAKDEELLLEHLKGLGYLN